MKTPKVGDYSNKTLYISFPEHLYGVRNTCRFNLAFKNTEVIKPDNKPEFIVVRFTCGDNDAGVSPGTEICTGLHADGQFASTYFWQEIFGIYCALKGKPYDKDRHEALKPKAGAIAQLFINNKLAAKYAGANVVATLTRRPKKRGEGMIVDTVWSFGSSDE